jgi:diketogulonate reductase-like aldo/keto reductase
MKENFESQFLQLSDEDMAELDNKDQNLVTGWDPSVSDPV